MQLSTIFPLRTGVSSPRQPTHKMKKTYEDYLTLVIDGELKKQLKIVATLQGKSINSWFNDTIIPVMTPIVAEEYDRVAKRIVNEKEARDKKLSKKPAEAAS